MANFIALFTSFRGRIGRKSWWLGSVLLLGLNAAGVLLLNPNALNLDPDAVVQPVWAVAIWQLLLLIPTTAIMVKRFNDRDWPYWVGFACGLIFAFGTIVPQFGFFAGPNVSMEEWIAGLILTLPTLFAFIVNGFLRGTKGPNRYGPDPLQSKST